MVLFEAFVQAVVHKFFLETGAHGHQEESFTAISYPHDLIHPWPREFAYRVEFFTRRVDAAAVVPAMHKVLGSEAREHVLSVFASGRAEIKAAYGQFGYDLAWTNHLMSKKLPTATTAPLSGADIRSVSSAEDVDAINALEPETPSSARAIDDPGLDDFVGEVDGVIVAKTQMVTIHPEIAYVSDMFTRPESRRKGLGSALLAHLEVRATEMGKEQMILIPSLMAQEIRFYEKHGYQPAVPMHVFVPRA
jgi:GNAT superfamily N-acetyltransferase